MADEAKSVTSEGSENSTNVQEDVMQVDGEDEEDVFEVERIMGQIKAKGGQTLYKVRWVGYGPDHDTYEPYENLSSCQEMLDEFIRKQDEKKRDKRRRKIQQEQAHLEAQRVEAEQSGSKDDKRKPLWKYVNNEEAEFDTLKDKFWRDLDEGKINVFESGDMYSKVKATGGRASRPQSFTQMFQNKIPVISEEPKERKPQTATRGKGKSSGKNKRTKSKSSTPDDDKARLPGSHSRKSSSSSRGRSSHSKQHPKLIGEARVVPGADCSVDSSSRESFEVFSSADTGSMAVSEDSSHSCEMEVKEDIVGVLQMPVGPSPQSLSHELKEENVDMCKPEPPVEQDLDSGRDLPPEASPSLPGSSRHPSRESNLNVSSGTSPSSPLRTQGNPQVITTYRDSDMDQIQIVELDSTSHRKRKLESLQDDQKKDDAKFQPQDPNSLATSPSSTVETQSSADTQMTCSSYSAMDESPSPDITSIPLPPRAPIEPMMPATYVPPHPSSSPDSYQNNSQASQLSSLHNTYSNRESSQMTEGVPQPYVATGQCFSQPSQPSVHSTHLQKPTLNNNKGETGDEEYEFDLEELDPIGWDGKIVPKVSLPEVMNVSNAELRQLVRANDYDRLVRAFRAKKTYDVEQPDHQGITLAMIAAFNGFDDVLELLMLRGASINAEQKSGMTPLIMACEQGLRCTVALLLEMGANVNHHTHLGETALIKAVKKTHKNIVKQLLDHGANFASPYNLDTPLKWAKHNTEISDLLNSHISRLKSEFEHQVQITLNNTAKISCALFPMQCFALRESEKYRVLFKHELEPTRPGIGMLLFIAHARMTSQEVRCRFYGPCAVSSAILNGVKLGPLTEEGNFVMSFCPLHNGRNELEIHTAKAPTSKAKLIICAYKAELV